MPFNAKMDWKFDDVLTENDMNRIEQGIKDSHREGIESPSPTSLNLGYGAQVIQADRIAPYNVIGFTGRTLVNLLGRIGNCENADLWMISAYGQNNVETSVYKYGAKSFKLSLKSSLSGQQAAETYQYTNQTTAGKKYIAIADIQNKNATAIYVIFASQYGNTITPSNGFKTSYVRFAEDTNNSYRKLSVEISGNADQYGYVDGIRLYEISQADYDAIPSMTPEQVAAKWPYVDDMKPITNPYVIKYGENLLPSFTEWSLHENRTATYIDSPYQLSVSDNDWYPTAIELPSVPHQTYTFNVEYTISPSTNISIRLLDSNRNIIERWDGSVELPLTFTAPYNVTVINILLGKASGAGNTDTIWFKNPMLKLGDVPKPFKPREDDYLFFPSQWCSNTDGSVADQLFRSGSDCYKLTKFRTMDLNGSLDWVFADKFTGYTQVRFKLGVPLSANSITTKYDGKILKRNNPANSATDQFDIGMDEQFYMTISNSDSGWGDKYEPSKAEIQAYFYGWKMFPLDDPTGVSTYNGSGTKAWCYRDTNNNGWGIGVTVVPASASPAIQKGGAYSTPFKLQYQLAQPVLEKIIPEGDITFHEGLNQIEVGNGMIVREKVNIPDGNGWAYINDSIAPNSALKFRAGKILYVYKNEHADKSWTISSTGMQMSPYLGQRAYKPRSSFDLSAAYTITYLALDQYSLTCNIQAMQGQYDANLKTNVDTLTKNQTDIIKRVSVIENTKAQKVQPQWITPTLLNGWVNYGAPNPPASYYLDDQGIVHLRGSLKEGATNSGVPIFILPNGYRPSHYLRLVTISNNGAEVVSSVSVEVNGEVQFRLGGNNWFILNGISFRAEQ